MDNNYDIFKYLKPYDNTIISNFKSFDLVDLIKLLNGYYLEYRDLLKITNKASIGCEIEYDNYLTEELKPTIDIDRDYQKGWIIREEGSIDNGGELCSPIFYNNKTSWEHFKEIFNDDLINNVTINNNCSSHVHIGSQVMGDKAKTWNNFLRLWCVYENVIFRFCFGEFLNGRDKINRYARPIAHIIDKYFKSIEKEHGCFYNLDDVMPFDEYEFNNNLKETRYKAVNFTNVYDYTNFKNYNTIEFRLANGSINPIIWQNLINLYVHLLMYSRSNLFNKDIILKRKSNLEIPLGKLPYYNRIYLDQAIEFSDLIFNKNIDKVYFLRQYLKNNQTTTIDKPLIKGPKFTK